MSHEAAQPLEGAGTLSASARRVQDAIAARGFAYRVFELAIPVRTAADAAAAVGCEVAQIAKSIIFKAQSGRGVLVITSGANRVNEARITELLGEPIGRADATFVREVTGFAIGGIPPLGHATPLATFIDRDLLALERIWAAAGHPNALFELDPHQLVALSGGALAVVT
jgi:prolyl-tRNA editing enzyme YbaK/EbsC (Cys-tRNA(Pro) deacylase)